MYVQNHHKKKQLTYQYWMKQPTTLLYSTEKCTQRDSVAMAFYTLWVKPLDLLAGLILKNKCKLMWYTHGSSVVGKLAEIKICSNKLIHLVPSMAIFPNLAKQFNFEK